MSTSDLPGKHRTQTIHPFAHAFMADVDASFMEQVFYVSQREWEANIHHYCELDDFRRCLEVAERVFGLGMRPGQGILTFKPVSADNTLGHASETRLGAEQSQAILG